MFLDFELKKLCVRNVLKVFDFDEFFAIQTKKVFDLDACFAIQMKTDSALEKKHKWAERPLPPGERVAELFMASVAHYFLVVLLLPQD